MQNNLEMSEKKCFCGSLKIFSNCCEPYLKGIKVAPTPETLMRSRYSAYATQEAEYLLKTTHISTRKNHSKSDILEWSKSNNWLRLEVLNASENIVEFKAYFIDNSLQANVHHEKSTFKFDNGSWFYVDGIFY